MIGVGGRPSNRCVLYGESHAQVSSCQRPRALDAEAVSQRGVDPERHAACEAVRDHGCHELALGRDGRLALDERGDREHVVGRSPAGRGPAKIECLPALLEGLDLPRDQAGGGGRRQELVARREEEPLDAAPLQEARERTRRSRASGRGRIPLPGQGGRHVPLLDRDAPYMCGLVRHLPDRGPFRKDDPQHRFGRGPRGRRAQRREDGEEKDAAHERKGSHDHMRLVTVCY